MSAYYDTPSEARYALATDNKCPLGSFAAASANGNVRYTPRKADVDLDAMST